MRYVHNANMSQMGGGMSQIDKLTPEQEALLPVYRDKWLKIGLATGHCDRKLVESKVPAIYATANLPPPEFYIWMYSPFSGVIATKLLNMNTETDNQVGDQVGEQIWEWGWTQVRNHVKDHVWTQILEHVGNPVGEQVGDQVWDQVWNQVWIQARNQVRTQVGEQVWNQVWEQVREQVGDQVRTQAWDQVGNQVWNQVWNEVWEQVGDQVGEHVGNPVWKQVGNQVWDQVGNQVWDQVWNQVWDQVRTQVWDQVWEQVREQVRDQVRTQIFQAIYGQHDSSWFAFYDYYYEVLKLDLNASRPMIEFGKEVGWCWPFKHVIILTERPTELHRDNENRLHADGRPALLYADGFALYRWHGLRIPDEWGKIPSEHWQAEWLMNEKNAELRRVLMQGFGYERVLKELKSKIVHATSDMELHRIDNYDIEPIQLLKVVCPSTGFMHVLRVPPDIQTCYAARNWTFGEESIEFAVET